MGSSSHSNSSSSSDGCGVHSRNSRSERMGVIAVFFTLNGVSFRTKTVGTKKALLLATPQRVTVDGSGGIVSS